MSRVSRLTAGLAAGSLLWGAACAQPAPAAPQAELSESSIGEVLTNMSRLNSGQTHKSRLEEEMKKSYKGFSLEGSLSGSSVPQLSPAQLPRALPNKRLQQKLEREKEWVFMRPEDFTATPSLEEILNLPENALEGQDKQLSPMERFFQNLSEPAAAKKRTRLKKSDDPLGPKDKLGALGIFGGQDEDAELPESVKDKADNLRKLLNGSTADPTLPGASMHGTLSDIFGLGRDKEPTPEQVKEHQDFLRRYQALLDGTSTALPAGGLADGLVVPAKDAVAPTSTPLGTFLGLRPDGYDPTLGRVNPTYIPTVTSDLNNKVLTQWNPLAGYSVPETPKPAQPFTPISDFPHRKF